MNYDAIKEKTKSKSARVIHAIKVQHTAEKLALREVEGNIDVKINGDYEDEAASKLKAELSRNWAYPIYKTITDNLSQWTDQNNTIEISPTNSNLENGLSKIYSGLSLDYYINNIFSSALFNRFNDLMIIEKSEDGMWPVLFNVPIHNVYDFAITGSNVDYLLYLYDKIRDERGAETQIFRYYGQIDGLEGLYFAQIFRQGEKVTIEDPIRLRRDEQNNANNIPVRQIGSLLFDEANFNIKESRIASVIDKLESYRRLYDIHEISKVIHAFPEKITISLKCPACDGTGKVEDSEGNYHTCSKCDGTGKWVAKKPTDITFAPIKIDETERLAFPEITKYVSKDIETIKFQAEALKNLRAEIISDATGITIESASGMKTATEVVENKVPLNSKLNTIITADVQPTFRWIMERVNELWYGARNFTASIQYQKFYTGLASNSIMSELQAAKENELNPIIKKQLEIDYVTAKYADNPEVRDKLIDSINQNSQQNEGSNLQEF